MAQSVQCSVLILAANNDQKLFSCLQSVKWAPEILLAWTGINQLPKKEEQKLLTYFPSLRIIHLPGQITDFSSVRNQLQHQATHDWVFWIDSDEQLQKNSQQIIKQLISSTTHAGFTVLRQDVFDGKTLHWGEVRNVRILRLFKKSLTQFQRPVHEVAVVDGTIENSHIVLTHSAHQSLTSFLAKIIVYAQIEAEHRYQQKKYTSVKELIVWPVGKFLSNFFLKLAFLDGWRGVAYAVFMSIHSFAVRAYLLEKQHAT